MGGISRQGEPGKFVTQLLQKWKAQIGGHNAGNNDGKLIATGAGGKETVNRYRADPLGQLRQQCIPTS